MEVKIEELDSVWCKVDKPALIKPCLKLMKTYWKPVKFFRVGQQAFYNNGKAYLKTIESYKNIKEAEAKLNQLIMKDPHTKFGLDSYTKKEEREYPTYLVDAKGLFYLGFKNRVVQYCQNHGIEIHLKEVLPQEKLRKPHLEHITFRPDQEELINLAVTEKRGVLSSATASGKTIVALGVISCFPEAKVLYLCHTVDLMSQLYGELEKFGFTDLNVIQGKLKAVKGKITVATRQTFSKLDPSSYEDYYNIILIDEVHHIPNFESEYVRVLKNSKAEIKLGFTGTMPKNRTSRMAIEGLVGPVIGELSIKDGIDKKIIAKPKVNLVVVYHKENVRDTYRDIYVKEVVQNSKRNRIIMREAKKYVRKGLTVLIMIKEIEHGELLSKIGSSLGLNTFVWGDTDAEERKEAKHKLGKRVLSCVIASTIWKEGIDIPSLDVVFNAGGSKDRIPTLQIPGRGFRRTDSKTQFILVDFIDVCKYLSKHAVERVGVYHKEGLL